MALYGKGMFIWQIRRCEGGDPEAIARVAQQAGVPIILGFLDYKHKIAGVGPVVYPSGDYEADLEKIKAFYRDKTAKYPEQGVK